MGAKLYIGNNQATPSIAFEKPTPMPLSIQKTVDANGKLIGGSTIIDLTGVKDIGDYQLYYAYYNNQSISGAVNLSNVRSIRGINACSSMFRGCTGITSVNLSSLYSLGSYGESSQCSNMFQNCTNLISIDLSNLTRLYGGSCCSNMFQGCTKLTNVNLSKLTHPGWYTLYTCSSMFAYCTSLTDVDLSSVVEIPQSSTCANMFQNCSSLTNIDLSSVYIVSGQSACSSMFRNCTSLTTLSFPALANKFGSYTNQFSSMLYGVTGCTVHFPNNLQSIIGSWSDVIDGFGGTNTVVLFDLPTTSILNGTNTNAYQRNPKYDTGTALAWRIKDIGTKGGDPDVTIIWTPYYTSGLADPVVGTTIYSDPECTIAVTTVDTIA